MNQNFIDKVNQDFRRNIEKRINDISKLYTSSQLGFRAYKKNTHGLNLLSFHIRM